MCMIIPSFDEPINLTLYAHTKRDNYEATKICTDAQQFKLSLSFLELGEISVYITLEISLRELFDSGSNYCRDSFL